MNNIATPLFLNDQLINKRATLNNYKIAWWLGLPSFTGGKYFYDLYELSNGTLTSVPSDYGWFGNTRSGGYASLKLSGNGDYVSVEDSPKFQFDTNNFTISGWFNVNTLDNANANSKQVIISRYESAGAKGWSIGVDTVGKLVFKVNLSSVSNSTFSTASGLINTDTWYHFTAIRSGITCYLYVNGKLEVSGNTSALWALSSTTQNLILGDMVDESSNHYYLSGSIDDICIFNTALNSAYALRIYEESRRGNLNTLNRINILSKEIAGLPWVYYNVIQNTYGVSL
jgi:hypothetical protein